MDDLISRQAAIDEVEKSRHANCHQDRKAASANEYEHRHFLKILRYLPQAEPQWIPVSERLPETTDEVLVTYIVNGNKKKRFVQTSTWYDNEEEGYWCSPWDEYLVPNTKIEVLAWMPLPEPYRGEE